MSEGLFCEKFGCVSSISASYSIFSYLFFKLSLIGRFLMKEFEAFLPLKMSLLIFLSFRLLLLAPFHVSRGCPLEKLPLSLKFLHLLNRAFSFILSIWPNHCSLLSSKHSLMLLNLKAVLNSAKETLSSDQTL